MEKKSVHISTFCCWKMEGGGLGGRGGEGECYFPEMPKKFSLGRVV